MGQGFEWVGFNKYRAWIKLICKQQKLYKINQNLLFFSGATKPVLDLSNNMRHVLVPADTKPGTTIYRLRASDADDDYPLVFRVDGKYRCFN